MAEVRTCLLKRADKYQALIGPIKPPLEGAVMIFWARVLFLKVSAGRNPLFRRTVFAREARYG